MSHYIEKCRVCEAVVSQCRCPAPNKELRLVLCKSCEAKKPSEPPDVVDVVRCRRCWAWATERAVRCKLGHHSAGPYWYCADGRLR